MSYDLMFQKAIELQNAGALRQAEDIYQKILQVMPENSDVWNLLGLIAQSKGELLRATDCFLAAIKYAPTSFYAHFFNLGLCYKSLNKPKEAIDALQRCIDLKKDFKEGWNLLGILFAENNDLTEAAKCFCKALDIDAQYETARANLCYYTKDLDTLIQLAEKQPDDFEVQFKAALLSEDPEVKEKFGVKAVSLEPDRLEGLLFLANLYKNSERFSEALKLYHKVLNLDENNLEAILSVADIQLALKNEATAEAYYLKSFNISRNIAGAHINYGTLLYQQKRFAEALEEYRAAVILAPEKPEISYNLALILKETGDVEEALGLMFNAHLKDPDNEIFAINIMETLSLLFQSNPETALKIAQNWQKITPNNVFSKRILNSFCGVVDEKDNALYAKKLFNQFAESYDITIQKLNPQIIQKFKELNPSLEGRVLDLGCGTGLAAVSLKNPKNIFDGVDVSENMLQIAQTKQVYENLYQIDIESFLKEHDTASYNKVLAFDVFCYCGDLENILKYVRQTEIWFSVEAGEEDRSQDFYPTPNGRYKHKKSYIERLLKQLNFKNIKIFDLILREENGQDVAGFLFGATKN